MLPSYPACRACSMPTGRLHSSVRSLEDASSVFPSLLCNPRRQRIDASRKPASSHRSHFDKPACDASLEGKVLVALEHTPKAHSFIPSTRGGGRGKEHAYVNPLADSRLFIRARGYVLRASAPTSSPSAPSTAEALGYASTRWLRF
jgi:hypothetical protein